MIVFSCGQPSVLIFFFLYRFLKRPSNEIIASASSLQPFLLAVTSCLLLPFIATNLNPSVTIHYSPPSVTNLIQGTLKQISNYLTVSINRNAGLFFQLTLMFFIVDKIQCVIKNQLKKNASNCSAPQLLLLDLSGRNNPTRYDKKKKLE